MSKRRSFMEDADRRIRRAAFEGGNAAWRQVEEVAAAALNAISGTRLALNGHRRIDHFLDVALFQAVITRKALDAMLQAVYSEIELSRRVLRLKAKARRSGGAAWYDLGAPLRAVAQEREDPELDGRQERLGAPEGEAELEDRAFDFGKHPVVKEYLQASEELLKTKGALPEYTFLARAELALLHVGAGAERRRRAGKF